jgi:hypothetical protein
LVGLLFDLKMEVICSSQSSVEARFVNVSNTGYEGTFNYVEETLGLGPCIDMLN